MSLLPCPFCGSNDLIEYNKLFLFEIFCGNCGTMFSGSSIYKIWNIRHTPWISIEKKPCPIGVEILITDGESRYVTLIDQLLGVMVNDRYYEFESFGVTHWMPLPKSPEDNS